MKSGSRKKKVQCSSNTGMKNGKCFLKKNLNQGNKSL